MTGCQVNILLAARLKWQLLDKLSFMGMDLSLGTLSSLFPSAFPSAFVIALNHRHRHRRRCFLYWILIYRESIMADTNGALKGDGLMKSHESASDEEKATVAQRDGVVPNAYTTE